jgi:hypothetical protein
MPSYRSSRSSQPCHPVAAGPIGRPRRIKVALYVRVSTDKQAEFGMSLEAQTAELQRSCAERN